MQNIMQKHTSEYKFTIICQISKAKRIYKTYILDFLGAIYLAPTWTLLTKKCQEIED